jgi:serine phosphatase RsbU (regulator of sigma subunit)
VVIDDEGRARLIEESAEPPLGASDSWSYREREIILGSGSALILYTDGLVERRGRSLDDGLEALLRAAETPWTNLNMLCAHVFEEIGFEPSDDLAVLTIRMDTDRSSQEIHTTMDADLLLRKRLR